MILGLLVVGWFGWLLWGWFWFVWLPVGPWSEFVVLCFFLFITLVEYSKSSFVSLACEPLYPPCDRSSALKTAQPRAKKTVLNLLFGFRLFLIFGVDQCSNSGLAGRSVQLWSCQQSNCPSCTATSNIEMNKSKTSLHIDVAWLDFLMSCRCCA